MGSPTKQKFKQGVQQEILTNYYLSKYDKFMSRMQDKKVQTTFAERVPSSNHKTPNLKRKNFKQLILQKRANQKEEASGYSSAKKNFKHQIQYKNSRQKVEKENKRNFYRLEDTIISELYKPSPSQLEKGRFTEIEVLHKVSYDQKRDKVASFRLNLQQEEENIQVKYEIDQPQILEVSMEKIEHERLSQAIKSSFQRRKSPRSKTKSPSKAKQQRLPPKSPNNRGTPRYQQSQTSRSREESYFFQNVRPSFENFQNQRRSLPPQDQLLWSESVDKKQPIQLQPIQDDRLSNFSRKSRQKGLERNNNFKVSRKSSLSPSINEGKRKNSSLADDSFHRNIPQIEHQPKISPRIERQSERLKPQQKSSQGRMSDNNRSMRSSRVHNDSAMKDSLHDFSMISRFSMISEEGTLIREQLERQLNENQFGPYQNALTSLLDLLGQHPNAWPIFVVGQRILQDRHQYENKRMMQQNQISRLQVGISSMKKTKEKRSKIQQNNIKILALVRQLQNLVSKN